ncbi:Abhd17a, partial [Symbiodinium pilosum]
VHPVRVAAFAEQFGQGAGSNVVWGPIKRWTLESEAVSSVINPDFTDAEAVRQFDKVRRHVQCVFAAKAHLWGNDWNPQACGAEGEEAILAVNVALCLPRLMRFCLMVKQGFALDGFVFEVRGKSYSSDLTSFALTVRRVLAGLSAGDPSGTDCFKGKIEGRGWYFQFAREPFFVTTFAPCYDESHPRFQFHQSSDSCFILLQPEESFLRHDLPPDKPRSATSWERPADVRDRIRANFRRHGREYRIPETTSYPPADFIVAPLDALHDPPVRFWESTRQQADKKESSAINAVAFPAPHLGKAFYQDELLRRRDLVFLKTNEDESIPACHVKAQRRLSFLSTPPATILYSHGNAEDVGLHLDYIDALAEYTGADVFSYEYVGYSLSRLAGHSPSEDGCIRSIDAAWRYLVDEEKIPPKRIVIFGRSIGSGPSVDLASRSQVEGTEFSPLDAAGVILQSPLESGACVVMGGTAATLGYYLDIFRNYEKIGKIKAPAGLICPMHIRLLPLYFGQHPM